MSHATSLTLLERVAKDDAGAWDRLDRIYGPLLQRWLAGQIVGPEDAADVAQQVLLVVRRKVGDFRHAGRTGAFRAWLREITVREVRAHRSLRRREPAATHAVALDQLADPASELSARWDAEYDRHVLAAALDAVRAEFADGTWHAFRLTTVDGRETAEAAVALGISVNAVRVARSRVLRRLRSEIDGLLDL